MARVAVAAAIPALAVVEAAVEVGMLRLVGAWAVAALAAVAAAGRAVELESRSYSTPACYSIQDHEWSAAAG